MKPSQVRVAVGLFYLALALTLIAPFIDGPLGTRPPGVVIVARVVAALLTLFLIEFISIGKNWARITYLVLTILSLPIPLMHSTRGFSPSSIESTLLAVQLLAHGIGLYLLFTSPGKSLFAPRQQ